MIVLASASETRLKMLQGAGIGAKARPARIDEQAIRLSLVTKKAGVVALALADAKARQVSAEWPDAIIIGCDQVLEHGGAILGKAENRYQARKQLISLRGDWHELVSAVTLYQGGTRIWQHADKARLKMRLFSDAFLDDYLQRNWNEARHSVGCYQLEHEGVRLFSAIEGNFFTILGLPLVPLLNFLAGRGIILS